jgi:hypothetical protein
MTYRILHRTTYNYSEPVTVSHHSARVNPRFTAAQSRAQFSLRITPEPAVRKTRTDYFGNRVCFFAIQEIHSRLEVEAVSVVTLSASTPPALTLSPPWTEVAELFRDPVSPEVVDQYQFCFDSPLLRTAPDLADYARGSFPAGTPLLVGVANLNQRIFRDFKYDPVATSVATPLEEVWAKRRGVCQDFAHLAIACLRSSTEKCISARRHHVVRCSSPTSTFVMTGSRLTRLNCWKTNPTWTRARRTSRDTRPPDCIVCPKTETSPSLAATNPGMWRSRVDFPDPDAPISATISPAARLIDTPSSALRSENDLWMFRISTAFTMSAIPVSSPCNPPDINSLHCRLQTIRSHRGQCAHDYLHP